LCPTCALALPAVASYHGAMLSRTRPVPFGFIEPCLPSLAVLPPSGREWVHEIKHDGYRLMARRDAVGIRLFTRGGYDWAHRYPLIVQAVSLLPVRSCLIDGEAVVCDDDGLPIFQRLRHRHDDHHVFLYAFDLLELDGQDLRGEPLEGRKKGLIRLLANTMPGLQLNGHIADLGDVVFRHACQLGYEGIVSKRLGSRYVSGRTRDWLKMRNPNAPAVRRQPEEDWGKQGWR
jgi:bifunctional non-homologous end joining protein LigD